MVRVYYDPYADKFYRTDINRRNPVQIDQEQVEELRSRAESEENIVTDALRAPEGITEWRRTKRWGERVSMQNEIAEYVILFGCDGGGSPVMVRYSRSVEYEEDFSSPEILRLSIEECFDEMKKYHKRKLMTDVDYQRGIKALKKED